MKIWLPYRNLTALHPGWGWGSRIIEIVAWTLSYVFIAPLRGLHWLLEKVLSKITA